MASILDAFALLAFALGERSAAEVEAILRRGDCQIAAVNLAEVIDQLGRVHSRPELDIRASFEPVLGDVVEVIPADQVLAWRAAELRRRYYRRRHSELSLADCFALATAGPGDRLATADPPLARAARSEGIEVLPLPDSRGRRP